MGGIEVTTMKYYKNKETGEVFAYESEQERQEWGSPDLVELTPEEIDTLLNPPPAPLPVPKQVSRAQGKVALIQAGLWQSVLDFVDNIEDSTQKAIAEIALNDTTHWRRDSPFLASAAQALRLTEDQLDDLFIEAAKIEL